MAFRPPKSSRVRQSRQHARPILSRAEAGIRKIYAELRLFIRPEDALHQRTGNAFRQIHENSRRLQGGTGGGTLDSQEHHQKKYPLRPDFPFGRRCRLPFLGPPSLETNGQPAAGASRRHRPTSRRCRPSTSWRSTSVRAGWRRLDVPRRPAVSPSDNSATVGVACAWKIVASILSLRRPFGVTTTSSARVPCPAREDRRRRRQAAAAR